MKTEFIMKRKDNYWWERTLVMMGKPLIMLLVESSITPNMVTMVNLIINIPLIIFCAWNKSFYILAMLIQLYMFLDIVDGNLARNKHMQSELGRRLDIFSDTIFYIVCFFFVGLGLDISIYSIVIFILVQQIYGLTATYYIVPKLKRLSRFEHTKIKKFFINKDILFGMDASLETLITSILLLLPIRRIIFIICPLLWAIDLIYRLYELNWVNRNNIIK